MNTTRLLLACLAGFGLLQPNAGFAAAFDSGSDGSYGSITITNDTTLDMPADGIFKCTTIFVATNATLTFNKNSLNTPVYLLAQGDVIIQGRIDVSGTSSDTSTKLPGRGGPGGFDGGYGAVPNPNFASEGQGPGGGRFSNNNDAWGAAFATIGSLGNTNTYGNRLLLPLIGGSGGSGNPNPSGIGGGGGAGAILIASNTRITFGNPSDNTGDRVTAYGGYGTGGGSGGAIRIVAPVVSGYGRLRVDAGGSPYGGNLYGGVGYVRIDTLERNAWRSLNFDYAGVWSIGCQMLAFPPNNPHLDILQVAGFAIPEGLSNAVRFFAPAGLTNTVVKVKASGFTGTNALAVTVAMTPDKGSAVRTDGVIPLTGPDAGMALIPVSLPQDAVSTLQVWTR